MIINNNNPVSLNFKGISPEVMKNFGKFNSNERVAIAKYYNKLNESPYIDLILHNKKLALKTKKNISEVGLFKSPTIIKKDSIIREATLTNDDKKSIELKDIKITRDQKCEKIDSFVFNFLDKDSANILKKNPSIAILTMAGLGYLIDLSQEIKPQAEKLQNAMLDAILTNLAKF